ncbi:MAG: DUF5692 family protein [Spirochaetes bacterium]|nr:DUF5692 family protein [Spirochaetota bacterium]
MEKWHLIWTGFAFTLILVLATWISNKNRKWSFLFTFIIPICLTTPIVLIFNVFKDFANPVFAILKLYSVTLSAVFVWIILLKPETRWAKILRVVFFGVNILEAVITEFVNGYFLNPIAGLLILLTLPGWNSIEIDEDRGRLVWDSSFIWVLAYSLWNICFSINLYPALWYLNSLHVVVAFIFVFRHPQWYAEIRAVSLNICFSIMIAFWPIVSVLQSKNLEFGIFASKSQHSTIVLIFSIITLIGGILTVVEQYVNRQGRVGALAERFLNR